MRTDQSIYAAPSGFVGHLTRMIGVPRPTIGIALLAARARSDAICD